MRLTLVRERWTFVRVMLLRCFEVKPRHLGMRYVEIDLQQRDNVLWASDGQENRFGSQIWEARRPREPNATTWSADEPNDDDATIMRLVTNVLYIVQCKPTVFEFPNDWLRKHCLRQTATGTRSIEKLHTTMSIKPFAHGYYYYVRQLICI